jgi:hypothetical protein
VNSAPATDWDHILRRRHARSRDLSSPTRVTAHTHLTIRCKEAFPERWDEALPAFRAYVLIVALLACPVITRGQTATSMTETWVGGPREDYLRLLQLTGAAQPASWLLRPTDARLRLTRLDRASNPWGRTLRLPDSVLAGRARIGIYDVASRSVVNSAFPSGGNDGALWAGRGVSTSVDAGVELRVWGSRLTIAPSLVYAQNAAFPLALVTTSGFTHVANADYTDKIDLPQRMGTGRVLRIDPGQTALRLAVGPFAVGVSTENEWWGPGIVNSILMSNNAPGLPHAFVASERPLDVGIGSLSVEWQVGRMTASGESTLMADTLGNRRWLDGIGLVFAPRFAPHLYLAAFRLLYKYLPVQGFGARDVLALFKPLEKSKLGGESTLGDAADQMGSLAARWVFPGSGLEIYGEWARNDHSWDTRDFILDPDHATGFLVGFQKVFVDADGFVRIGFESIDLPGRASSDPREGPMWYIHEEVQEGYTQRGQLIGASIGPVGTGQYVSVDAFRGWGRVGAQLALVRHPDEHLENADAIPTTPSVTLSAMRILGSFDIESSITFARELNRYHEARRDRSNIGLLVRGVWRL